MNDLCEKCGKEEPEFGTPAFLCALCWSEWWYSGVFANNNHAAEVAAEWDEWLEARDQ